MMSAIMSPPTGNSGTAAQERRISLQSSLHWNKADANPWYILCVGKKGTRSST